MSQQVLPQYAPIVNVTEEESIPAAILGAQTRNGKDELITGAGAMVWDSGNSLWVPVSQSNPLEARVRHLEALVGALNATKETNPDAASATLLALLRGLMATGATESTLGSVKTAAEALAALIDSGALKTTLTGSNVPSRIAAGGLESVVASRSGPLADGTSDTLIDYSDGPVDLESLSVSTTSQSVGVRVYPYLANGSLGEPLRLPGSTGTSLTTVNAGNLNNISNGENDFFRNAKFDAQNDRYVMVMKRQAKFGNGIRVQVVNTSGTSQDVAAVTMVYKERF